MSGARIRVEESAPVARIWLARPEQRNAFDTAMLTEYVCALESLGAHPEIRTVVVAADGRHFCAGWDTGEFADLGAADPEAALLESYALLERVWSVPVITIGAIRGTVAGFGVGMLHRLHLAVGSSTLRIVLPEINFGIAAASVLVDLQRELPRKAALDLLLSGDAIGAERAVQLGLVSRVVADDGLDAAAVELAQRIAAMPGSAAETVVSSFRLAETAETRAAVQLAARGAAQTIKAMNPENAS